MAADLVGKSLGPFVIEGRLGQGAMGLVYRARHEKTGKPAAIKVMTPPPDGKSNETLAARFEREIKLLSQFRHANIVRIFGSSEQDGIRYYAMELVEGQSLQDILDAKKKLSFQRTIAYAIQICDALQEIHGTGVVHRDLKPGNLLVTADHRVKLTDFGIAKNVVSHHTNELTQADHTVGTVAYMSPEQLSGQELTRRSDIYALGILLYRMLTGRLPFTGDTMFEYMNQRMAGKFARPSSIVPDLPLEFDELIGEMLAQNPDDRPRDAYVVMQKMLDINKRAKEGTLLKTRPKTQEELAETVPISTPVRSFLRTLTGRDGKTDGGDDGSGERKKKKKAKGDSEPVPFYETGWFLGGCLALVVGVLAYAFWPPGPAALLERGNALLAADTYPKWREAVDQYFVPLIQDHPEFAREHGLEEKVRAIEDKIAIAEGEGIARQALRFGLRRAEAGEAERVYIDALILKENYNDPVSARDKFKALIDAFGDSTEERNRPWVLLARRQFDESVVLSDDERIASKRAAVKSAIAKAQGEMRDGKRSEALKTFAAVEEIYRGDGDVADLLAEAAKELKIGE